MRMLNVFLAVLIILSFTAITNGSMIAAGGGESSGTNFSQCLTLPGFGTASANRGSSNNFVWAGLGATLNEEYQLSGSNWNFYTYSWDTSLWHAELNMNGFVDYETVPPVISDQNNSFSATVGEVSLYNSSSVYSIMDTENQKTFLCLSGYFTLSPASIYSSNCWISEQTNTGDGPIDKYWHFNYSLEGRFVASTPAEAKAMGAPFAQPVPEPSFILLAFSAIPAFAVLRWKQRKIA